MKKVVIFGANIIARMLCEDTERHSGQFEIAAVCADEKFIDADSFSGYRLTGLEEAARTYPPGDYDMISAVDAPSMLRNRLAVFERLKKLGYYLINYVSPMADVSKTVRMGESNIILPFTHMGYSGIMGNANIILQNSYVAHDFTIGNGNMVASAKIAGSCQIDDSCFIGVGATVKDFIHIQSDSLIGAGCVVIRDTKPATAYAGNPARVIGAHAETGVALKLGRALKE